VRYQALPWGSTAGVYNNKFINQNYYCNQWVVMFNRYFEGSSGGYVRVIDNSRPNCGGIKFAVDAFLYT
jgi:hypothetical protein